MSFLLLVEVSV